VLSKDTAFHDLLVSLRVHGQAVKGDIEGKTFDHDPKYLNMRVGMNSRMDTIQAAVLLQKLSIFADEIEARNRVADRYAAGLSDVVTTPKVIDGADQRLGSVHASKPRSRWPDWSPERGRCSNGRLLSDPDPQAGGL